MTQHSDWSKTNEHRESKEGVDLSGPYPSDPILYKSKPAYLAGFTSLLLASNNAILNARWSA